MSRWLHGAPHGDCLIVKESPEGVSIYASTTMAEDDPDDEAVAVFNLSPAKARDMAQWLVIYANASEADREPPEIPPTRPVWWNGPPELPVRPTAADRRTAYQVLVCSSRRNITELGWHPADMTVADAVKIYDAWAEWSNQVLAQPETS